MVTSMLRSNSAQRFSVLDSIVAASSDCGRRRSLIRQYRQRLDECYRHEVAHVAMDFGRSANEPRRMTKLGLNAGKLLPERMAALHLDAETTTKGNPGTLEALPYEAANAR